MESSSAFYENHGMDSWAQKIVPNYITTNPFMAEALARIAMANILDSIDLQDFGGTSLVKTQPAYIIELGTGTGRLCYLILRALERLAPLMKSRRYENGSTFKFCFIMPVINAIKLLN